MKKTKMKYLAELCFLYLGYQNAYHKKEYKNLFQKL